MHLASFFINRGFSANVITALGLLVLTWGLTFILLGAVSHWNFIVGASLINAVILLDNVDGHVARCKGQVSKFGTLLDAMVSWLHQSLLPVCLGLALFFGDPECSVLALGVEIPAWVWLAAGVVRMFAYLLSTVVGRRAESLMGGRGYDERVSKVIWVVWAKALIDFEPLLLFLAAVVGALSFLHVTYALYRSVLLVLVIVRNLRDAALADQRGSTNRGSPTQ